jgi:hypothetical protein
MWKRLGAVWCSLMHEQPMWPIHGRYECGICGRQHEVAWAEPQSGQLGRFQQQVERVPAVAQAGHFLRANGEQSCGWRTC